MNVWTVEQKQEVWYQTSVHADSMEEAIKAADQSDNWERMEGTSEFTDDYWVMNEETHEQYTVTNGIVYAE